MFISTRCYGLHRACLWRPLASRTQVITTTRSQISFNSYSSRFLAGERRCSVVTGIHVGDIDLDIPKQTPLYARAVQKGAPDRKVFEDLSEEYAEDALKTSSDADATPTILERLIVKGDFDGARLAKDELLRLDVTIEPNEAFLKAALHALPNPSIFLGWWSLLPNKTMEDNLPFVYEELTRHSVDISFLSEFCLSTAKAGLTDHIGNYLLPQLFRLSDSESIKAFINIFAEQAQGPHSYSRTQCLNLAIRMKYVAQRQEEAVLLLNHLFSEGLEVEPATSRTISRNVASPDVRSPLQSRSTLLPVAVYKHVGALSPSELAKDLRILRQTIKADFCVNLAPFLARFIRAYEHGRAHPRALRLLRSRVLRYSSYAVRTSWIAGEQMAYSQRGRPLAVLRSFLHYCAPSSIPLKVINDTLSRWEGIIEEKGRRKVIDWPTSKRDLVPIDYKIWPNSYSLFAAWKSLVALAKNNDEIEFLYKTLIESVKRIKGVAPPNQESFLSHSIPIAELPDAAVFHQFLMAFATRCGPLRGARVLSDMTSLGIKPSMENWSALAGVYARSGDAERVNSILMHIKDMYSDIEKAYRRKMLHAYNSIIRGYTECTLYQEARTIQKRMEDEGYLSGEVDKRTKGTLHRLARYEKGKFDDFIRKRRARKVKGRMMYVDRGRVERV